MRPMKRTRGAISARFCHDRSGSVRERIVELMESGAGFGAACRAVGIHPATGRRWLQRDKHFLLAVKLPRLVRRMRRLEAIR